MPEPAVAADEAISESSTHTISARCVPFSGTTRALIEQAGWLTAAAMSD
jgi:hypothetical protein